MYNITIQKGKTKKIKSGRNTIRVFDSAKQMNIRRYNAWMKYVVKESEIGGDLSDLEKRLSGAAKYIKEGMKEEAANEIENLVRLVWEFYQDQSPTQYAFACLVFSINGEECDDYSPSGLDEVLEKLDKVGLTQATLVEYNDGLKKKSKKSWKRIFRVSSQEKEKDANKR